MAFVYIPFITFAQSLFPSYRQPYYVPFHLLTESTLPITLHCTGDILQRTYVRPNLGDRSINNETSKPEAAALNYQNYNPKSICFLATLRILEHTPL